VGFYEPVIVLAFIVTIYVATKLLSYRVKREALWWLVAVALSIGATGAGCTLLSGGSLGVASVPE
jgi:hypothetical protein